METVAVPDLMTKNSDPGWFMLLGSRQRPSGHQHVVSDMQNLEFRPPENCQANPKGNPGPSHKRVLEAVMFKPATVYAESWITLRNNHLPRLAICSSESTGFRDGSRHVLHRLQKEACGVWVSTCCLSGFVVRRNHVGSQKRVLILDTSSLTATTETYHTWLLAHARLAACT